MNVSIKYMHIESQCHAYVEEKSLLYIIRQTLQHVPDLPQFLVRFPGQPGTHQLHVEPPALLMPPAASFFTHPVNLYEIDVEKSRPGVNGGINNGPNIHDRPVGLFLH